jgi:hypothetical protein
VGLRGNFWQQSGHNPPSPAPLFSAANAAHTEQNIQPATGYLAKYRIGYDQEPLVEFDVNNCGAAT